MLVRSAASRLAVAVGSAARGARAALLGAAPPPPRALLLSLAGLRRDGDIVPPPLPSPAAATARAPAGGEGGCAARAAGGADAQQAAAALLPALTAAWTLVPDLVPSLLHVGKGKHHGKNKRMPKKANHGARPCSHVMRRRRAAVIGRIKPKFK